MMLFGWVWQRSEWSKSFDAKATNETEGNYLSCILFPHFNFFWSQVTNLFVRNFKQTSIFLSVRHFGVFLATKAVFLAGIGIENGWCLTERGQSSQGLKQINDWKPPERHVNKRDNLFCLSDFVFLFLVMVNSQKVVNGLNYLMTAPWGS